MKSFLTKHYLRGASYAGLGLAWYSMCRDTEEITESSIASTEDTVAAVAAKLYRSQVSFMFNRHVKAHALGPARLRVRKAKDRQYSCLYISMPMCVCLYTAARAAPNWRWRADS